MWTTLRVFGRVLLAPVYVLWLGYRGLWWAFDDSDERRAAGSATDAPPESPPPPRLDTDAPRFQPVQSQAFEVVDSTPRAKKPPIGALRGGFGATLVWTVLLGLGCAAWHDAGMSASHAWVLWGWASAAFAVASLFVVRHVARREEEARPQTIWGHTKAAVGGLADAGAAGWAATRRGVRRGVQGVRAGMLLAGRIGGWSGWGAIRRRASQVAGMVRKPREQQGKGVNTSDPAPAA